MTRGSLAKFFGGGDIFKEVDDRKPRKTFVVFFLLSVLFQLSLWTYKKIRNQKVQSFSSYINSLRKNLGA